MVSKIRVLVGYLIIYRAVSFDIGIVPHEAIKGSSYIPLPNFIAHKKAVINVKNLHDHKCFLYAVTSALYLQWIEFPISLKDITKFEKQNDINICVIVHDEKQGFHLGKPIGVGETCQKLSNSY